MVNYQNSKIYKLIDNTNGDVYIGSTTQTLSRRLDGHRGHYKHYLNKTGRKCLSFKIIKNNDYKIILICNCPCNNIEELHKIEQKYIDEYECINQNRAYLSKENRKQDLKQNRLNNLDYRKQQDKKRYEEKKDIMKQQAINNYKLNRDKKMKRMNELRRYKHSWGGDLKSHSCNLLKIDLDLFT